VICAGENPEPIKSDEFPDVNMFLNSENVLALLSIILHLPESFVNYNLKIGIPH
jgi:hypothetical protein